jgi:hypothetical protein
MPAEISRGQLVLETCFETIFFSLDYYLDAGLRAGGLKEFNELRQMMLKFTATCRSLRLLAETYIYSVLAVDGYTCRLGYRSLLGVDRMERMEGWRIPKLERVRYVPLYFNYPSTNNLPVEVTSKMHNCRPAGFHT